MPLRPGDRLSIQRGAVVQLTQYDALKPRVTLTRDLGDDPEADRADMERILYVELRRALLDEINTRTKFERVMGPDVKLTPLIRHCEKVIARGPENAPEGSALPQGASQHETTRVERKGKRKRRED